MLFRGRSFPQFSMIHLQNVTMNIKLILYNYVYFLYKFRSIFPNFYLKFRDILEPINNPRKIYYFDKNKAGKSKIYISFALLDVIL